MAKLDCTGPCDVVEFGCGFGTFTIPAAQAIAGTVFAFDIEPAMVAETAAKAAAAGLANVRAEVRDLLATGCGRPAASADYALLFNILHAEEPVTLLAEAFRVLRPGGRAAAIHWKRDVTTPRGPSLHIRPTPAQCQTWAEQAGFRLVRHAELCCCSWHWGMLLERPDRAGEHESGGKSGAAARE